MTGNRIIDMTILSLSLVATMAALGVFVYTEFVFERPLPIDREELEKLLVESKSDIYPNAVKMERLVINLQSRTKRLRFLEIDVHLSPFRSNKEDLITENIPLIRDAIIEISGKMDPSELNSISGKILLETRLKKAANQILGGQVVKDIFFSKFVVQ